MNIIEKNGDLKIWAMLWVSGITCVLSTFITMVAYLGQHDNYYKGEIVLDKFNIDYTSIGDIVDIRDNKFLLSYDFYSKEQIPELQPILVRHYERSYWNNLIWGYSDGTLAYYIGGLIGIILMLAGVIVLAKENK